MLSITSETNHTTPSVYSTSTTPKPQNFDFVIISRGNHQNPSKKRWKEGRESTWMKKSKKLSVAREPTKIFVVFQNQANPNLLNIHRSPTLRNHTTLPSSKETFKICQSKRAKTEKKKSLWSAPKDWILPWLEQEKNGYAKGSTNHQPPTKEKQSENERERKGEGEKVSTRDTSSRVWKIPGWSGATSPHPAEQAMTNIMIIPAAPSPSLVVLSLATSAILSLPFALPFQLPRSNPSFVLWQHQGARVANMGSHIWGCGRGFPVARGNRRRRYPDIDLGATRRVARLLSGRENVITALWWLR